MQWLLNGLAIDNTRGLTIQRHLESVAQVDISLTVDSLSQRIDNASQHVVVDTDRGDTLGTLYHHALLDARGSAQKHTTHVVLLEVHHDGHSTVFELKQLVGLGIAQSVDTGHTIAYGQYGTNLVELLGIRDSLQLVEQYLGNFAWFNLI